MTPEETWQKACVITGQWTPNQRCVPSVTNPCDRDDHWPEAHFIECPSVGDPAATVKMLEWAKKQNINAFTHDDLMAFWLSIILGDKELHDLAAAAIVAIGRE